MQVQSQPFSLHTKRFCEQSHGPSNRRKHLRRDAAMKMYSDGQNRLCTNELQNAVPTRAASYMSKKYTHMYILIRPLKFLTSPQEHLLPRHVVRAPRTSSPVRKDLVPCREGVTDSRPGCPLCSKCPSLRCIRIHPDMTMCLGLGLTSDPS